MRSGLSRRAAWLSTAALLAGTACAGMSEAPDTTWVPPDVPRVKDGLDLVTVDPHFEREYLKPNLDLSRYHAILPAPLQLVYTPEWARIHHLDDFGSPDMVSRKRREEADQAALARLRDLFRKALEKHLAGDGSYRIVDEAGPGVLVLSASIVDLDLRLADADFDARSSIDYSVTPLGAVAAKLEDGGDGSLLGELLDSNQEPDRIESEGSFWAGMDDALDLWAKRFRAMLGAGGGGAR